MLPDNFQHNGSASYYVFLDLDFDGIPELLTTGIAGSGIYSSNKFYKLNSSKDGVVEITYGADSEEMYDFNSSSEFPKLLKNRQNGNYIYWCSDAVGAGAYGHGATYGKLEYTGTEVKQTYMFSTGIIREGGVESNYYNIINSGNYTDVGETEYNKQYESFMLDYEDVNLKTKFVNASDFANASETQQRELFKTSIKGFNYNGYVSLVD